MRYILTITVLFFSFTAKMAAQDAKLTAFTPGKIWKDDKGVHINAHGGGVLAHKGVYYWFGEHKVDGEIGNTAQVGVHVYASKDLYNWKDEGIALTVSSNPTSDIVKGSVIERPKVVYNKKTKKFVMWFHLELKDKGYEAARTGLAVADKVTGPYVFIKSYRPNAGIMPIYTAHTPEQEKLNCATPKNQSDGFFCRDFAGGQMARDMTVFVDDDGKAYHIFSSEENYTLHLAELSDDYLSHTGKFTRIYVGQQTEAPALFKKEGLYYMIGSGCTGWDPNPARWFTSTSIWGPWIFKGNPCVGEGADKTYGAQSTFVLPILNKKNEFIFMADMWRPKNAIDGRYLWLPIQFDGDKLKIAYMEQWELKK
ncbi:MAG: family 43 glycosylhydrolase [Pedobacter sp.]|nr:family 43 glycosylhydrolase [Pedobacter sp.]